MIVVFNIGQIYLFPPGHLGQWKSTLSGAMLSSPLHWLNLNLPSSANDFISDVDPDIHRPLRNTKLTTRHVIGPVVDLMSPIVEVKSSELSSSLGTGASCIYPLLGATMNGWYFLATEVDDICFDYATKNVEQNNLSDLVKGKFVWRI